MISVIDIKDIVYSIVKSSDLANSVSGIVSKTIRPTGSDKEDIIISVLDNEGCQMQQFIVNVNIYVSDLVKDKDHIEDSARIRLLCSKSIQLFESIVKENWRCELQKQVVLKVEGKNEHCINNRILINYLNS